MKSVRTICFAAVVLFLCDCPALGLLEFKDGLTHDINYQIDDNIYVDWQTPDMFTTVNWLAGGSIDYPYGLKGYNHSRINIRGGSIKYYLFSYDSSQVDISGGSINDLRSCDSSQVNISGGDIGQVISYDSSRVAISGGVTGLISHDSSRVDISGGLIGILYSSDSSQVDISGGSIGDLLLSDQSKIQISGCDFAVNSHPVGYGELTSIFGGDISNEPWRWLTGTLASGKLIDTGFTIGYNARIVLIPEPASALLMIIGATILTLRRKKR